jgi:hypothetical protein
MAISQRAALEALLRDHADIGARSRMAMRISPGESDVVYDVNVVGVIRSKRILVLTAPTKPDGSLIAVNKGQSLTCRWFSPSTAFRFRATITRLLFEPVPLVHVELPSQAERRTVRGVPRALVALRALLRAPEDIEAVVLDLSTGGARVAVVADAALRKRQEVVLLMRPTVMHRPFELAIRCQVSGAVAAADNKHQQLAFYGLTFLDRTENNLLVLHAYVHECLAAETDVLTQLLWRDSKEVDSIE